MITAQDLKELPSDQVEALLSELTPKQIEELTHDYRFWARPKQVAPEGDWKVWFLNCGRGFGKTWTGVQWVREQVKSGKKRIAAVAATNSDIERVMVKGDSGFLALCSPHDRNKKGRLIGYPLWSPTKRTLTWHKDGDHSKPEIARVEFYSAQEPERLRGPQFDTAWCDELAAWVYDEDTWDMLNFCLRLGKYPRVCVTTTPKSTKLVRKLVDDPYTHVTVGNSYENEALPDSFFEKLRDEYEGTRLGKQEIYAEILKENEGALWTADMIDSCQIEQDEVPDLERIVVSVDPATTSNVESDDTGIIVAGIDYNGNGYILEDHTFKDLPERWAQKAIELYHSWGASRIVYEKNQGGDMIPTLFRTIDENIPLRGVFASNSKIARAEPVSSLYERGKVFHVRNPEHGHSLTELETQMTTFEPMGKHKSPDRYDAMVWAITDLMLKGFARPKLTLVSATKESLKDK